MAASIGIVGWGAIGQAILREADAGKMPVPISGVTSRTESTALEFLCEAVAVRSFTPHH